jgi:hypothetical protein
MKCSYWALIHCLIFDSDSDWRVLRHDWISECCRLIQSDAGAIEMTIKHQIEVLLKRNNIDLVCHLRPSHSLTFDDYLRLLERRVVLCGQWAIERFFAFYIYSRHELFNRRPSWILRLSHAKTHADFCRSLMELELYMEVSEVGAELSSRWAFPLRSFSVCVPS